MVAACASYTLARMPKSATKTQVRAKVARQAKFGHKRIRRIALK